MNKLLPNPEFRPLSEERFQVILPVCSKWLSC